MGALKATCVRTSRVRYCARLEKSTGRLADDSVVMRLSKLEMLESMSDSSAGRSLPE